ncbi:hypothetical protein HJG60_011207 [Phyllostomus discolor]|uniref:Uncharacterized protein n=1 Tax=Phyllostomus discolor TaxID=89673 RepID=A0A834E1H4_9CHIR|nr:hypothetical protein HJG60_011207 [Phyllostomus discolor]
MERPTGGEEGTREVAGIQVFLELKEWRGVRRPQRFLASHEVKQGPPTPVTPAPTCFTPFGSVQKAPSLALCRQAGSLEPQVTALHDSPGAFRRALHADVSGRRGLGELLLPTPIPRRRWLWKT